MPMAFTREEVKNLSNGIAAISVLLLLAFGAYYYVVVRTEFEQTRLKLAESESRVEELEQQLASAKQENSVLLDAFYSEQAKMDAFSRQIEEITGVVGILQQLQGTDRELLQKYSRTYFLSENYVPSNLAPIQERYLYNSNDQQLIHADVQPHLENMINTAASANVDLKIVSAYRSAYEQSRVNSQYNVVFGRGANQFSAEQGYSEHQLGTTADFTTPEIGAVFLGFEDTRAYEWLSQNAYQYGFVLSYPEGNPYYIFEPWHWRFVGVRLAAFLHEQGKDFYDLGQEAINQYLLYIFD